MPTADGYKKLPLHSESTKLISVTMKKIYIPLLLLILLSIIRSGRNLLLDVGLSRLWVILSHHKYNDLEYDIKHK